MLESAVAKWLIALALSALALLAPVTGLMGAVGVLIGADFITGVLAARKRGEALTSKAMSRTITKALVYQLAVISAFALEGLVPGGLPIAKLIAAAVALVEFRSLTENVKTLTGVDMTSILEKIQKKREDK